MSDTRNVKNEKIMLLQVWSCHAATFKWLHDRSAKKLQAKSRAITIPTLVLNAVSGVMIYRTEMFNESKLLLILFECVVGSLNMACVILNGIRDYSQYAETAGLHRQSFQQWAKFKNEIYVELVAPSVPVDDFITQMKTKYVNMIDSSPNIPNDIIKTYESEIGDQEEGYTLPDIIDGASRFRPFDVDLDEFKS